MFEDDRTKRMDEDNTRHAIYPEPGDYWHEMFCPIRVVLAVTPETVTICETTKSTDKDHWTWDLSATKKILKEEFANGIRYKSEAMKHKFSCDVVPRGHAVFVKLFQEMQAAR